MRDAVEAGEGVDHGVELLAGHARRRQRRDDFDVVSALMFGDVLNGVGGGFAPRTSETALVALSSIGARSVQCSGRSKPFAGDCDGREQHRFRQPAGASEPPHPWKIGSA